MTTAKNLTPGQNLAEQRARMAEMHYHQSDGLPGHRTESPCTCHTPNTYDRNATSLLEELERRGYTPQEHGWFDYTTPAGTIRVAPDDTDIVIHMFDQRMVNLWTVRLSSPPEDVMVGALNIAQASLALQARTEHAR